MKMLKRLIYFIGFVLYAIPMAVVFFPTLIIFGGDGLESLLDIGGYFIDGMES